MNEQVKKNIMEYKQKYLQKLTDAQVPLETGREQDTAVGNDGLYRNAEQPHTHA